MKETFYFSHDYNARSDDKIKKLIRKHNLLGYGVYWAIVEDLYNNANALHTDYEGIAYDLRVDEMLVKSIVNDFDLFIIKDKTFYSESVNRRLDKRAEKSENAKMAAKVRWDKHKALNADALLEDSDSTTIKDSKVKDILKTEFLEMSDTYFEAQAMQKKLKLEKVKDLANKFWTNNYFEYKGDKDLNEIRRHFANWLDKQKEDPTKPIKGFIRVTNTGGLDPN